MKAAFHEIIATASKRRHEPQRVLPCPFHRILHCCLPAGRRARPAFA
jgi:hypothetical protein